MVDRHPKERSPTYHVLAFMSASVACIALTGVVVIKFLKDFSKGEREL